MKDKIELPHEIKVKERSITTLTELNNLIGLLEGHRVVMTDNPPAFLTKEVSPIGGIVHTI